ncbi:UTP--glucose-1-phosphate uridylyltransferase [Patescibacteria group bacterium]|nr:UTP--glucose-1-phosphate uridylyltransferase [Patescibacteria group bacterium]
MTKIKKAIIPVGGSGKRFLPSTKSIPKEMFPVGNQPVVMHVVEEIVRSGIEEIIFVLSTEKQAISHFFSPSEMQERLLLDYGKEEAVRQLREISQLAHFSYVYKTPPYGNGGALWPARHLVADEPFVVAWGDEFFLTKGETRIKQCMDAFYRYEMPIVSAIEIEDKKRRSLYGIGELKDFNGEKNIKEIVKIVEKPEPGTEPSSYATHGAYIFTPAIFDAFVKTEKGKDNELWMTDLINTMKPETGLLACIIKDGVYLDCGNYCDYLRSQIEYELITSPDPKNVKKMFKNILKKY